MHLVSTRCVFLNYATTQSLSFSLSFSNLVLLLDDLQKVDHEDLSSPRASDISLQRHVDVVRGFSRGLLLFRACIAFEDVSLKETRSAEPLLQIVICVHQGERNTYKDIVPIMKVSIKHRWRDFPVARKTSGRKILFYAVTIAFPGFWRDERIIARRGRRNLSFIKVIKAKLVGEIGSADYSSRRVNFHSRDMSLKTISNFVACDQCSVCYVCIIQYETSRVQKETVKEKKISALSIAGTIAMNQFREIYAVALSITIAHACIIFFRRARSQVVIW